MDKYVVRGKICDETKERKAKTKSLRQTRIEHGSKVVVLEVIQRFKEELDEAKTTENMMRILKELENQFVSLEMLEKTLIGRSLCKVYLRTKSEDVKKLAGKLLKIWKRTAKEAIRRREQRVQTFGRNFSD